MDEYSEVLIAMACAVYSSKIIPDQTIEIMKEERLSVILPQLASFGEDEIASAVGNADHGAIDVACGHGLLKFVKDLSVYLPEGIVAISSYLYDMWYQYLSRRLNTNIQINKDDPLNYGKEEFSRFIMDHIESMSSKLSSKDRLAIRMLSLFVLYRQDMKIPEEQKTHGIWALIDLLYRKTRETETISHVLHIAVIREEIWKKNLFVG